tara:strand:- start:200 stop:760 length:561 start_codon:yes stop_codon:yes gene_type:complete
MKLLAWIVAFPLSALTLSACDGMSKSPQSNTFKSGSISTQERHPPEVDRESKKISFPLEVGSFEVLAISKAVKTSGKDIRLYWDVDYKISGDKEVSATLQICDSSNSVVYVDYKTENSKKILHSWTDSVSFLVDCSDINVRHPPSRMTGITYVSEFARTTIPNKDFIDIVKIHFCLVDLGCTAFDL